MSAELPPLPETLECSGFADQVLDYASTAVAAERAKRIVDTGAFDPALEAEMARFSTDWDAERAKAFEAGREAERAKHGR